MTGTRHTYGFNTEDLSFDIVGLGNYLVSLDPVFVICKMELLIEW